MLTEDQVRELVRGAVTDAIKAVNTPDPTARPAAPQADKPAAPAVLKRNVFPSKGRALRALLTGRMDGIEREIHEAGKSLWYSQLANGDSVSETSIIWPRTPYEMVEVLSAIGETKTADKIDGAIKAMTEALTVTVSGGTGGGLLVPPEFRQDLFAYALAPRNALRRVAGVRTIPVTGHDIRLPRETTRAGASQAAEAGTLSSADATLAQQTITIEKQYAMRRWSGELSADSDPAFSAFLDATVVRDLDIQQDIQWLRGTGSTPQVVGLINYTGLTTSTAPVVAATNGAKLTFDDVFTALYDLDAVNAEGSFAIGHPRTLHTQRTTKDAQGRYLISTDGTPSGVGLARNNAGPDAMLANTLPFYKTTNLTITQTVGTSTDCSTIIVGDAAQVLILERQGVELMISPHVYFTTDELAVRAIARSAVAILQPTAVTLLTGVRP